MENSKSKILSDLDISEKKIENSTKQCINTLNASQINRLQMEIVSSDNKVNSLRSFYEHKIDQLEFHKNVLKGNVMDLETKLTIIENEKNIKYQQMNNLSIEKINKFTELEEQLLNTSMEHEKLLMEKNQLTFKVKNLETQIASKFLFLEQKIDTLQKDNDSYQKNMLDNEAWIEKLQARLQNSQNVEVELKKAQFKIQELEFDLTAVRDGAAHGLAIQNQVERLKVFEFENKLLNEKYQLLKESQQSSLVYQDKIRNLEKELSIIENYKNENVQLNLKLEKLKNNENKDDSEIDEKIRVMNGQIESLRQTNAIYVSTQSKMQISLGKLQNNLKNSGELCFELNERVDLLEKEISSREMTINRLSYKVNYYEKEKNRKRDHQRNLITEDVTEPEINGKDKEREMLIKTIETLEKEIISYKSIVNDKINNKPKLNISHCIEPPNQQIILNLREELSDITNKYEKLRKESNYKILSLKNNPYESAISQDKKKCKQLVEDNLKFKQRIVFLENAVKAVKVKTTENCTNAANFSILNNLTFQVNSEIKNPSAEPLVGELREKLNSAQLTQKRLNEVFEDSIKKFQQIYFNLTGFLIKNISRNVYSISTNFNSSNDNVIMIQDSGENIKILRNKFYDEIPDEIKQSLVDSGNIQCFFATYLLHLYN